MTIAEGHFRLYTHVAPALKAGAYRFDTSQSLSGTDKHGPVGGSALPIEDLQTYVNVTSPRYLLPPDQVLSTYPPAGTEGAYGARLPQVVIKRRTLPWERAVDGGGDGTPWLALVVYAEGEAEVLTNIDVAQCVSPGVTLDGTPEVEKASCLEIRSSVVATIMPTRKDVPLLAHAREVNINDTEMMMGDDDGFLAVVVANRLPVSARNADGTEAPVKYHAVLVSLEGAGQFGALLPESPPATFLTQHMVLGLEVTQYAAADYDHQVMDSHPGNVAEIHTLGAVAAALEVTAQRTQVAKDAVAKAYSGTGAWQRIEADKGTGYRATAVGTGFANTGIIEVFDPKLRFPALLHWSFTSVGNVTFEELVVKADSGLLGTRGQHPVPPKGRAPLEVVETGHVGLDQRTRRGDLVRAWYRGPLLPHPADLTSARLTLAHTGDQLRAVIPDGREDLSLAAAFEIGRLLALSQPSMVASLLRWRQTGYQAARAQTLWSVILSDLSFNGVELASDAQLSTAFGRGVARAIAKDPATTLGQPRELLTPGTPMPIDGDPLSLVAKGFGIEMTPRSSAGDLLSVLRSTQVPRVPVGSLRGAAGTAVLSNAVSELRDIAVAQFAAGALSHQIMVPPGHPGGIFGGVPVVPRVEEDA